MKSVSPVRPGRWWKGAASRVLAVLTIGAIASAAFAFGAQAAATGKLPPIPACFSEGSGYGSCDGMAIPGGSAPIRMTVENFKGTFKLTGPAPLQWKKSVACGDLGCVYHHLNWSLGPGASAISGCQPNQSTCEVKVAPGSSEWTAVFVRQDNDTATLWAIWNTGKKGAGTISGYVRDKDGHGASGIAVDGYSTEGKGGGTAVSGDQGYYSMEVEQAGTYKVIPSGGVAGSKKSKFVPADVEVHVAENGNAKADFALQGGLQITLTLGDTTVNADGLTVVRGTVQTTQFGKPLGGVKFSLRPKANATPTAAVASGARATICQGTGRLWPTGSLNAPVGTAVDETTDATGKYEFTITVGTVPGSFELVVWAYDTTTGALFTKDLSDTSDDATLTLKPTGSLQAGSLIGEIRTLQGVANVSSALKPMTADPTNIVQILSGLAAKVPQLGGVAYSVVNGAAGGGAVLVYDQASPPVVNPTGGVFLQGGLVISPSLWTTSLTGTVNDLLSTGALQFVPTFQQWAAGVAGKGWSLVKNTATLSSQSFVYNGWPYPSTSGDACN